jgi:predicted RNase H-like HicB family nuclease
MRDYYGIIYADGDGFTLLFPDLPGCVHHSKNMVEAVTAAADALSAFLANLAAQGEVAPAPSSLEQLSETPLGKLGIHVLIHPQ